MPSMILTSNEYIIQIFSFVGSYTGNLVVITLSILPLMLYYNWKYKYTIFFMLLIPIFSLFLCAFLRFHFRDQQIIDDQLITIVQPNIKQQDKWNLIKRKNHIKKLLGDKI